MEEKICNRCGKLLPLSMFHKNKGTKDGHLGICKVCTKEYNKKYYEEHKNECKEKRKQYYSKHREEELLKRKEYQKKYKEQIATRKRRYYEKNKDKISASGVLYREAHQDECSERSRRYYREHHEACLENKKQYYIENKDTIIVKNQIRRARINSAIGEFTEEQVQECIQFFGNVCAYSGENFSEEKIRCLSLDHIIPLAKNGTNFIWNIIPTTFSHNASKGTKDMLEWYQKQDFYLEERLQKILEWQEYAYNKWGSEDIAC